MKKIISLIAAVIIAVSSIAVTASAQDSSQMRGAWMATVYNIDFPSTKNNVQAQKDEFTQKLDTLKNAGINAVFVQVRPSGDALYKSAINPWSSVLTGTQGVDPGYDPMAFMIEEAHKRDMEFHAWLNPYRVTTTGTDTSVLANSNPAKQHPDWLINYGGKLTFDPANDNVKELICDTVEEIVKNYDVDGIHFDDYFYPNGFPLRDGETAQDRINDVSEMIKMVYDTVKKCDSSVDFGVSPMGICVNTDTFRGSESVSAVYADPRQWIEGGYIDYIIPQIYWETNHSTAPYESVLKWWNDVVDGTDVELYVGEGLYKDVISAEIDTHLNIDKKYENVSGNVYYSTKNIIANLSGCSDSIKAFYSLNPQTPSTDNSQNNSNNNNNSNSNSSSSNNTEVKTVTALATNSSVLVNGEEMVFEAYNIDGYNYFKLRDIAYVLSGSEKQFDVTWDNSKEAINIETNKPYTVAGGELEKGNGASKTAVTSTADIYLNGSKVTMDSYNIDGYTYYKLRDVAKAVDFAAIWSENTNTIGIVTLFGYEE